MANIDQKDRTLNQLLTNNNVKAPLECEETCSSSSFSKVSSSEDSSWKLPMSRTVIWDWSIAISLALEHERSVSIHPNFRRVSLIQPTFVDVLALSSWFWLSDVFPFPPRFESFALCDIVAKGQVVSWNSWSDHSKWKERYTYSVAWTYPHPLIGPELSPEGTRHGNCRGNDCQ